MQPPGDYCSFTKAVEHLGDRWSLQIVRELAVHGSLGFNALAGSLPGISRSVLSRRLRKLEVLGLVEREPTTPSSSSASPYRLAPAGADLVPTLLSLYAWADRWVPDDPEMARRDPSVILPWLAGRVDLERVPIDRVVVELEIQDIRERHFWLVLERGAAPSICLEDPGLPPERRIYIETDRHVVHPIARGLRDWRDAIADGSVAVFGEPALVRAFPGWFHPVARDGVPDDRADVVPLARAG